MKTHSNAEADILLDLIKSRRSIRCYIDESIPRSSILRLLEAATWAPSAHNRQPWRFAVITEPAVKDRLARAMGERLQADRTADGDDPEDIGRDVARSYVRLTGAPVLILVCSTMADMDTYPDPQRAHNERIMAGSQFPLDCRSADGLAACWLCAPLFVPALVQKTLKLPDDWEPQGVITLGKAAETREKTRLPLDSRVKFI